MPELVWVARAISGTPIRLTSRVWFEKILHEHPEFAEPPQAVEDVRLTIEHPAYVVDGWAGELLARYGKLLRRGIRWPKPT